jgi:hypothetical protein
VAIAANAIGNDTGANVNATLDVNCNGYVTATYGDRRANAKGNGYTNTNAYASTYSNASQQASANYYRHTICWVQRTTACRSAQR